jgi:hypothetical protein
LELFCFGLFGDFIPKGENVRPKQASGSKDMRPKGENVNIGRRSKRGKVDLGGVLDDGRHPRKCKWF